MRFAVAAAALAVAGYAAPAFPKLDGQGSVDAVSRYFNAIAVKVHSGRPRQPPPPCDLSRAQMPLNGLPPPSPGLTVRHVAIGRGTQNYTCDASDPTASPQPVGALATLYNVTCVAVMYPEIAAQMPAMAVALDLSPLTSPFSKKHHHPGPGLAAVSGVHYFVDAVTPFFDMDMGPVDLGEAPCAKNGSVSAPATAAAGRRGEGAVPWLKLTTKSGATGGIKEVYRVDTAGGSPPATCRGQPAAIEVQYSALYWFWGES